MKIKKVRKNVTANTFVGYSNLSDIAEYVRSNYDPLYCTCKEICEGLAKKYSNLIPVEASVIVFHGEARIGGHWVCKVRGTNYILDPTADQFDFISAIQVKRQIAPWLFVRGKSNGERYLSMNHAPYYITEDFPVQDPGDIDILKITRYPFYKQLKFIRLD